MANLNIRNTGSTNYLQYGTGQQGPFVPGNTSPQFESGDILDGSAQFDPTLLSTSQPPSITDSQGFQKWVTDFIEQATQKWRELFQSFGWGDNGNPLPDTTETPSPGITTPQSLIATPGVQQPNPATTTPSPAVGNPNPVQATTEFNPATMINVADFGVKGDGTTDNTQALNTAFAEAKRTGKTAYIPPGTYNHSGVITADGINVTGSGPGTVMRATNPDQSAIKLTGNNGSIANLKTEVVAPNRSSMPDAAGILVQNASGATVSNVIVQGAASNGIRLDGATNSNITHNMVTGTNADGIALMNGSSNNKIENCVVDQAGDDAFSDDSYTSDRKQDTGNVFKNCLAQNNHYGRGFALMGSANDTIDGCYSVNTPGHGVAAGTDYNSGTMTGSGHTIKNSVFIGAKDTPIDANGMNLQNNSTSGNAPDPASILGFDPGTLPDRYAYNASYRPGTGPGANNTPGNRT